MHMAPRFPSPASLPDVHTRMFTRHSRVYSSVAQQPRGGLLLGMHRTRHSLCARGRGAARAAAPLDALTPRPLIHAQASRDQNRPPRLGTTGPMAAEPARGITPLHPSSLPLLRPGAGGGARQRLPRRLPRRRRAAPAAARRSRTRPAGRQARARLRPACWPPRSAG